MRSVTRSRTIEVQLTQTGRGSAFRLPDQPDLRQRGAVIQAIETFIDTDASITPDGGVTLTLAQAQLLYLIVMDKSDERIREVPYLAFRTTQNAGQLRTYNDLNIQWQQSRLVVADTLPSSGEFALITIHYKLGTP